MEPVAIISQLVMTEMGNFLHNSIDLHFTKVNDAIYVDVTTYNYGNKFSEMYLIDNKTYDDFKSLINETIINIQKSNS